MRAYSTELSMDHYYWQRYSSSCNCMLEMDIELWFLDMSDFLSRKKTKYFETKRHYSASPLLASLSEVLNDNEDFLEPHLNSYQLHTFGELLNFLFWRYNPNNGQYSLCLSRSSHRQIFWHKSRSGRRILYPTNRTKNQLCSLETHLGMLVNWQTTPLRRKRCYHLYSVDQPPSGTKITLPTLLPGRMSEHNSSLDFQMDETNFDIDWKWNIVLEEMETKFETSYTVWNERLIKAGPMLWTVFRPLNITQNEKLKDDKEDRDTLITH